MSEADLIAIDTDLTAPVAGAGVVDPADLMTRLIFRTHPEMVRAAWVRGRILADGRVVADLAGPSEEAILNAMKDAAGA